MLTIHATYRNGTFEPNHPVDLEEGLEVSVIVNESVAGRKRSSEDLPISDLVDDRPMTPEEIAEWEVDMREADKYRMSDDEYVRSVAERLERKREQLRIQAVIWEQANP